MQITRDLLNRLALQYVYLILPGEKSEAFQQWRVKESEAVFAARKRPLKLVSRCRVVSGPTALSSIGG